MGFVGWALAFVGSYFIGRKVWWGFLLSIFANIFIGINAWETKNPSLGAAVVAFVTIAVFNIFRWRRDPPEPAKGYDLAEIGIVVFGLTALAVGWFIFGSQ